MIRITFMIAILFFNAYTAHGLQVWMNDGSTDDILRYGLDGSLLGSFMGVSLANGEMEAVGNEVWMNDGSTDDILRYGLDGSLVGSFMGVSRILSSDSIATS